MAQALRAPHLPESGRQSPEHPAAIPSIPSPFNYLEERAEQDGADSLLSSTSYAQKSKRIMELYQDLLKLGSVLFFVLELSTNNCLRANQEFDLPKVVVIGSQSSTFRPGRPRRFITG